MALAVVWADHARAQTADSGAPPNYSGPPAPLPPALAARDAEGRITLRAVRVDTPLNIDGQIDEAAYQDLEPISDFIQMEPAGGQPATEKTEVWLFFDQDNVYVTIRAWESRPESDGRERDAPRQQQHPAGRLHRVLAGYLLRSAERFQFEVNPLGARTDGQSTNERQFSADWNPVWDLAVGPLRGRLDLEAAIPFKSLRYRPGRAQVWGFNARRNNKWKNEISYLDAHSAGARHRTRRASRRRLLRNGRRDRGAGRIEEPRGQALRDRRVDRRISVRRRASPTISTATWGVDVKYGVTQNLTADFTYNTDFAQVEADEQQVNLTRFSLFFPEKREFFLENPGTFAFGGAGGNRTGGGGESPILFYSRRIGFNQGREVPIPAAGG